MEPDPIDFKSADLDDIVNQPFLSASKDEFYQLLYSEYNSQNRALLSSQLS